jgi:GH15 family glucan-1,4-alpha-glucosidase
LTELTLPWLPGYEGSAPVRVGNAAAVQSQLDIYGELMDALHLARDAGLDADADAWNFQRTLVNFLASNWQRPDSGIWEMRGEPQQFTHSKVMAWVALDRAVKAIETYDVEGPLERWREVRAAIHAEVCEKGVDAARGVFVQRYGSTELDASLLLIPLVGFLPPDDPRIRATIAAIERELVVDGLVLRYRTAHSTDGLPPGEGYFLPCSFWLADNLALCGRHAEADALFERLLALRNDVGMLSEEYDLHNRRALGNTPQALTHVALINTARNLSKRGGPSEHRSRATAEEPPGAGGGAEIPLASRAPGTLRIIRRRRSAGLRRIRFAHPEFSPPRGSLRSSPARRSHSSRQAAPSSPRTARRSWRLCRCERGPYWPRREAATGCR